MPDSSNPLARRVLAAVDDPHARLCFSPCRVNLIGDHIDYVGGTVVPMSLDRGSWLALASHEHPGLEVHALDESEVLYLDLATGAMAGDVDSAWVQFVVGLLEAGERIDDACGGRIVIAGELRGGGLSSSASFCVGLARALMELGILRVTDGIDLARLAQQVEHQYLGVQCGLMDQLSVVCGREDGAMVLDCGSGSFHPVTLAWGDRCILALRSTAPRDLSSGGYNRRRAELAEGLARLDCAPDALPDEQVLAQVGDWDLPMRRVRHVVTEQARVHAALAAAERGDWAGFGAQLSASHASLRDDYEVSVDDMDRMIDAAIATPGCEGARMTGGGFGGWGIALVREHAVEELRARINAVRGAPLGEGDCFVARPGGAVRMVEIGHEA